MTLKLQDGVTSYNLSFNLANATVTDTWAIVLRSQLSHEYTEVGPYILTIESTNDRYTEFSFTIPADLPDEHKNGIYEYTIQNVSEAANIQTGLLKLVCGTGGEDGYTAYESDNEERGGPVYYRPQY